MSIIGHSVTGNFNAFVRTIITDSEGFSATVYADTSDIPTIGYGFALLFYSGGTYSVRSDLGAASSYASIPLLSSPTTTAALSNIVTALNNGNPGLAATYYSSFSTVTASAVQAQLLFDYALNENLGVVRSDPTSVSGTTVGAIFQTFETNNPGSKEIVALYDLAYNNPDLIGPGLADALHDGDRARAWYEILYNHGNYTVAGVMNRREMEANLFSLTNDGATAPEVALELNTLFNGTDYASNNIYDRIQARDSHKPFETQIEPHLKIVRDFYAHGEAIDYIQIADGTWITGGTINSKDSADHAVDHLTRNLIVGSGSVDTISGNAGNDYLYGMAGGDTLNGGDGDDWLSGGAGADTLNGGNGSDTADYSKAAGPVTVSLGFNTASDDGDSSSDSLSSIENVMGSDYSDVLSGSSGGNVFYGSTGDDDINGLSGTDTVDYRYLPGIVNVSFTTGGLSIAKGPSGSEGTDTLAGIETVVGSRFNDFFAGIQNAFAYETTYAGGTGSDRYTFDVTAEDGVVNVLENADLGLDSIKIDNFVYDSDHHATIGYVDSTDEIWIQFSNLIDNGVGGYSWSEFLRIEVDASKVRDGTGVEILDIGGQVSLLSDFLNYVDATSDSMQESYELGEIFNPVFFDPGTGGTGAGGGASTTVNGGGSITGVSYSPTISSGDWVPYPYGTQSYHAPVITSFFASSGSMSVTTESYVKEINFSAGITLNEIRFTLTNNYGNADLNIHVDALGQTFTIPYFEAGKTINGLGLYNTGLHSWIQGGGGNFSGGNGNMSGSFSGTGTPSFSSGTYNVTYFLETISAAGGSINMQGDLTFTGSDDGDNLYGLDARDDTIMGMDGGDALLAYGGNDTLIGGAGNDSLLGYDGDDVFIFAPGDGADVISEALSEGADTIRLTGYSTTDVRLYTDNSGYLYIENKGDASDLITVYATYSGIAVYENLVGQHVEEIVFDDTTVWSLTGGLALEGSSSGEGLYGTAYDDTIYGMAGGDGLFGNHGNDILIGGAGNDSLIGYLGDDTYVFSAGDGSDTVSEYFGEGADSVHLSGYLTTDVRLYTDSSGYLYIENKSDPTDLITIYGAYSGLGVYENVAGRNVEEIFFDDTTVWSLTGGLTLEGSGSSDSLFGTAYDDTIYGMAGADGLYGNFGNDTLIGGAGADSLLGARGDDIYVFAAGDGADTVSEYVLEGIDTIRLSGYLTTDVRLYTDSSGYLYIENKSDPTDLITIYSGYSGIGVYQNIVGQYVEKIIFDDTTVWSLTGGLTLEGTSSGDSLFGTGFGDTIKGMDGGDGLYGNAGDDLIQGGNGSDTLLGGDGNDILEGGADDDTMDGEGGSDTASYLNAASAVTVTLATVGTGQNTGGAGTDTLSGIENLIGSAYNDTLTGDGNANIIEGGAGNDAINGAGGTDTVSYAGAGSAVTVNLATGTAQNTGGAGTDTLTSMENLLASAYNDTITGSSGNNVIDGGAGNDTLDGSGGTDTVSYANASAAVTVSLALGSAQNTIGAGTDTLSNFENLTGSAFGDVLTGSTGNNTIAGGDGDDTVEGGAGNDTMTGGNGTDTVSFANAGSATTFNLGTTSGQNTVSVGTDTVSGFENILGSAYNDTLTGNSSANVIEGGAGNDTINGSGGTDTLTYRHAASAVTVNLATGTAQNTGGAGTDTISNFENLTGSDYNDTLTGNSSNNTVEGGAGNDTLDGSGGTDTVTYVNAGSAVTVDLSNGSAQNTGGAGTDTLTSFENLTGSGYNDTLTGSTGNNTVLGGDGNDTIYGNSGTDTLKGGNGNDTLSGQAGTDTLYGEGGSDIFAFEVASAFSNQDTIADFSISDLDVLNIAALLVGWNPTQSAIDDFVTFGTSGANMTLSVDRDGTGGTYTAQAIATLSNISGLDADDLLAHGQLLAA